jgi:hypothetical protein
VVEVVVMVVVVSYFLASGGVVWSRGWVDMCVCAWWCVLVVGGCILDCVVSVEWVGNVVGLGIGGGVVVVSIVVGRIWGVGGVVSGVWSIVGVIVVLVGVGGLVLRLLLSSKSPTLPGLSGDPAIFSFH